MKRKPKKQQTQKAFIIVVWNNIRHIKIKVTKKRYKPVQCNLLLLANLTLSLHTSHTLCAAWTHVTHQQSALLDSNQVYSNSYIKTNHAHLILFSAILAVFLCHAKCLEAILQCNSAERCWTLMLELGVKWLVSLKK